MKKLIYIIAPILVLAACTKEIDRFNVEKKKPAAVPPGPLFSNALKSLSDGLANASVNINVFRFTVKHWAMAVYQDEAQYNFTSRAIPQAWWSRMYKDVLVDLKESSKIIAADAFLDPDIKANQLAILDITAVYTWNILVNTFGDIPYKESLDPDALTPAYEDAKTIYTDLLSRLATDITKLNTAKAGFTASEDLIGGGSISKWIKFANSLQMKMGMTVADVADLAATAKTAFETADTKAINAAADNVLFTYLASSPNTNPLYTDIELGGRADYVAAKDLMDPLIALSDPRKSLFFGTNNDGKYVGGIVGKQNTFSDNSKPATKVYAATAPYVMADYVELEFLRAEAKERGFNVAGTAESHYNNAITASIVFWGGTPADAATYLAQPAVAYATAATDWKQKIGFQKWIALYSRPFEGWTELRRLDYPVLPLAVGAFTGFPNRFTYPGSEQQLNGDNYKTAAARMGNDKAEFKLFWDKF